MLCYEYLSPVALEIIAEQGNPEWFWLLLGTYVFLRKNIDGRL